MIRGRLPASALAVLVLSALIGGCHGNSGSATSAAATAPATTSKEAEPGPADQQVTLTPQEIQKLGVLTAEARSITHERAAQGFAVVMAHEPVAQAVSEIVTALAAERQSRSALERAKRLAGTPGALPAEVQESATRQAATDAATLNLARQHLTSLLGQGAPAASGTDSPELAALASGRDRLVRVTFPLGSLGDEVPTRLRLARIDSSRPQGDGFVQSIWQAPSDATVPGRSFFAVLKNTRAAEGEHLLSWAEQGTPESGVLVPSAAVILSAGRFWCYVETRPGTYVRRAVDTGNPTDQGYFVTTGVSAGGRIVIKAAALLLARETNPATEAE
jgi:hypothetical protein